MEKSSKLALSVLLTSLLVGFVADLLLKGVSWGINFPLTILALAGAGAYIASKSSNIARRETILLTALLIFFSAFFAWRDSSELKIANGLAVFLILGVIVVKSRTGEVLRASIADYTSNLVARWLGVIPDFYRLLEKDIDWKSTVQEDGRKKVAAITRGLLLAIPLLILFGALFANADPVFNDYMVKLFDIDGLSVLEHTAFILCYMWIFGGLLRRVFLSVSPPPKIDDKPQQSILGITEVGIVMGALNVLFAAFVIVQFQYFFGGAAHIAHIGDLTYAQYARKGFFELVTVAALCLPIILAGHSLLRRDDIDSEKIFRVLATVLVGLLFVVMASAFQRMKLYVDEYGLTILRLYTTAAMVWLGLTFVWILGTVLRGRGKSFAFGSLALGLAVIFGLNLINPDALIVRTNVAARGQVDVQYLTQNLSSDAVPALMEARPQLNDDQQMMVNRMAWAHYDKYWQQGWRAYNLSRIKLPSYLSGQQRPPKLEESEEEVASRFRIHENELAFELR